MRQIRKKREFHLRDRGLFPCFTCPWCDTQIGLWEQREDGGMWYAPCAVCGAAAAFFGPFDPQARFYLR